MSSKRETTATKEEASPAVVPKLRFPEFRGAEGWENTTLGDVTTKTDKRNKGGKSYPVYSISNKTGFTPQSEQFDGVDSEKRGYDIALYKLIESKTFAYNPARINVGSIGFSGELNNVIISSLYVCFQTKSDAADEFLLHFFGTSDFEKSVNNHVEGGIRSYLFYENFARIGLPLPSLPEQQKIAECLSSVDELMAVQARKVDALKTHKRGLMQQLFPREGETQPRVRFPEFQNAGEWEVRTIGDMFRLINGCAFKPEDWKPTGTPIIRIQNLNDPSAEFNYSQAPVPERNRVESGDLLFAWSGTLGSSFGARVWNGPSGVLNQHIFKVLMDEQQITLQFALLVLARVEEDIAKKTHGFKASFVHVKKSDLVKVDLLLPSLPEQQRIASCLSSLDALITLETQKLEALKTHKKGLMQQLFPSVQAVEA